MNNKFLLIVAFTAFSQTFVYGMQGFKRFNKKSLDKSVKAFNFNKSKIGMNNVNFKSQSAGIHTNGDFPQPNWNPPKRVDVHYVSDVFPQREFPHLDKPSYDVFTVRPLLKKLSPEELLEEEQKSRQEEQKSRQERLRRRLEIIAEHKRKTQEVMDLIAAQYAAEKAGRFSSYDNFIGYYKHYYYVPLMEYLKSKMKYFKFK